jgi:hypothetical protein
LSIEAREKLNAWFSEHENHQLSLTIESLLAEGRKVELTILLKKQAAKEHLQEITSTAVMMCLGQASRRNAFYERFMLGEKKGIRILPIERGDSINHLSQLFAVLDPRTRWEILSFAFSQDYDVFVTMVQRGYQVLRKHGDDGDEFKKSVFAFLWTEAGKLAKEQLFIGTGSRESVIEKNLNPYQALALEMNDPPRIKAERHNRLKIFGF